MSTISVVFTTFPIEILEACMHAIREFQQQHGVDPSKLHFPNNFEWPILGAVPLDSLGKDIAVAVWKSGPRGITRATLDRIDLEIVWGADEFNVT